MRMPSSSSLVNSQPNDGDEAGFDACGWILIIVSYFLVVITFPITAFFCINVREEDMKWRRKKLLSSRSFKNINER